MDSANNRAKTNNHTTLKWYGYVSIVAFVVLIVAGLGLAITTISQKRAAKEQKELELKAKGFKQKADSIAAEMEHEIKEIKAEFDNDTARYSKEKKALQIKITNQRKDYAAILAHVDTLNDSQLNRLFSIREMLSDSNAALHNR